MSMDDFRQSPSGRLMKVGSGAVAYRAFVPHPLPPDLPFTPSLVRALSDADRALGELAGLGRTLSNPQLLVRPYIRREAVLSSRIEGTQSNIADLYAFEAGQQALPGVLPAPPEADVREVHNYVTALEYGIKRLETLPVSLRLIRELHERLMKGVRGDRATPGEFRRSQNWIGRPGCTLNEATFVPPPVHEMDEALGAFEKYLHAENDHPPLLRLAFIHYQFEAIHPFLDGNGRIGRLLITLLLTSWNLLGLPLLYLSVYFERRRDEYYHRLAAVSRSGAWEEWATFFLVGVTEQSRDAISRAGRLQDLQASWRNRLQRLKRTTALPLGIVDALFENPTLSATQVARRFDVTHQAAMKALRKLEALKIVREITDRRRNQIYLAEEILKIVSETRDTQR